MITRLKWKPDFEQTVERFEAWWLGELIDRPPVTLHIRPSRPYEGPPSHHLTARQRWLDARWRVESAIAEMARRDYAGDSFPLFWPNVGPEITAALFGCELQYDDRTHWSIPIVHSCEDWQRVAAAVPDFSVECWQAMEKMTDLALELSDGRFAVGLTDLHGNYDILAALRDPEALCMDLLDCPDAVARAGHRAAQVYVECFNRCWAKLAAAGMGASTWTPAWHGGPMYVPSCDFWCMVSPRMAEELILPEIVFEMRPLERSIFHLDGPAALKHLDLLLRLPQLNAIQWVYGAGAGPASRWLDVYRRCLAAGKSVQIFCQSHAEAIALLNELGPRGVWLDVQEPFDSLAQAQAFLDDVARYSHVRGPR